MPQTTIVIRVDFPALDNLVTYLRETEQSAVDATAASVGQLTARLKTSADGLQGAVTKEK